MRNLARIVVAVFLAMVSIAGIGSVASAAPPAGSISGTVYRADGTTPLAHARVNAYDYNLGTLVAFGYASEGSYTISGLGSGSYRVMARADGHCSEYYSNVADPGSATPVTVTNPNNTANINFSLAGCGSISGSVVSDNGTPIYSGHVRLFDSVTHERVDETWMTATSNAYRVGHDLPSGSYIIRVEADGYLGEYYNNVSDIDDATPVAVASPNDAPDINFTLNDEALHISAVTATLTGLTMAAITWTTDQPANSQVEYGPSGNYNSRTVLDTNLVTSHSVNLSKLNSLRTYHYRVKSSDAGGNPAVSADFTLTTTDVTKPSSPVVSDDGESTTSLTQLYASWTSSDADSGVTEYQYAIGTASGGTDLVNWTSVGTNTAVTNTELSLSAGRTYYFTVKAKNGVGLWSDVGTSDGIVAQVSEETLSDGGGGMPAWAWVLIGLGAVAALSAGVYFDLFRKRAGQR